MNASQTNQRISRRQMLRIMAQGAAAAGLSVLTAACGGSSAPQGSTQATAQAPAQSSGTTTLQFIT
jgi:hypothetical protein